MCLFGSRTNYGYLWFSVTKAVCVPVFGLSSRKESEDKKKPQAIHFYYIHRLHCSFVAVCFYCCCCLLFLISSRLFFSLFFHLFHFVSFVRWVDTKCFEKKCKMPRMVEERDDKVKLVESSCKRCISMVDSMETNWYWVRTQVANIRSKN